MSCVRGPVSVRVRVTDFLRMLMCGTGHGSDSSHPAVMRCPALTHREGGRQLFKNKSQRRQSDAKRIRRIDTLQRGLYQKYIYK